LPRQERKEQEQEQEQEQERSSPLAVVVVAVAALRQAQHRGGGSSRPKHRCRYDDQAQHHPPLLEGGKLNKGKGQGGQEVCEAEEATTAVATATGVVGVEMGGVMVMWRRLI